LIIARGLNIGGIDEITRRGGGEEGRR
jgi:hypothetical protein